MRVSGLGALGVTFRKKFAGGKPGRTKKVGVGEIKESGFSKRLKRVMTDSCFHINTAKSGGVTPERKTDATERGPNGKRNTPGRCRGERKKVGYRTEGEGRHGEKRGTGEDVAFPAETTWREAVWVKSWGGFGREAAHARVQNKDRRGKVLTGGEGPHSSVKSTVFSDAGGI